MIIIILQKSQNGGNKNNEYVKYGRNNRKYLKEAK